ncbi:MAG: DnaD domain protein [Clostridia bacterium]|nr:DnaD domain protein [Clostridia bacterium]
MAFLSASDGFVKKSTTSVENKFISKYLPALDAVAAKVYLYSLYLLQSGLSYTLTDLAHSLELDEDKIKEYFVYLEELELVSIVSDSPFEVKILEAENIAGTPKKFKPEKYSDFTKNAQNALKGRMISTNEFREYFYLMEEYGFEQNALIMIINYCVNLHGDSIRAAYIKKVAKSFAEDGATTAKKVDEKLSAYTSSTPALINLFNAAGIKKQPDLDDDKLYKKWTNELGFDDKAIICAAKQFKAKNCEKLDDALSELYKNRKFDAKEIEDYFKNKNSVYALALDVAKNLGVYMQTSAPYVENYVNVWCNYGFTLDSLREISAYCFKQGKNSFEDMDGFVGKLYDNGIVAESAVTEYLEKQRADDKLIKDVLTACGLQRKIIPWDRDSLARWRSWGFNDEMLFEAAKISSGKSNPTAYMNGVLSSWKASGIFSVDKIPSVSTSASKPAQNTDRDMRVEVERHYYDLRHTAEENAERTLKRATADEVYGGIRKELNELSIKLAFAEIRDKSEAEKISAVIKELEAKGDERLSELAISKDDFTPHYSCTICNDTGYDKSGAPCECMKKFISGLKI